ncbi:MAG TPA: hypothetical protein ENJ09_08495 [Planctomycetes bacterium]|nr:hypothetical protein [Planctomycetota bacterium]
MPDRRRNSPAPLALALYGLLAGSALGVLEVHWWMRGASDPSVLRRAARFAWQEAALLGALGFLLFAVAGLVSVLGARWKWRSARDGSLPVALGTLFTELLALAALVGLGHRLARHSVTIRGFLLLLIALAAVLAGWCVARRTAHLPGGPIARALRSRRFALGSLVLFLAILVVRGTAAMPHREGPLAPQGPPGPAGPNVALIVIDTLRADALGCMGGEAATPNLDALAARGTLFEEALAPSSWTLPATGSLFTSTQPWRHGLEDFGRRLDPDLPTLPERLSGSGWRTRAVVANPFVNERAGFARGFELFDVYDHEFERRFLAARLFGAALEVAGLFRDPSRALLPRLASGYPFLASRLSFYVLDEDVNARVARYAPPPTPNDAPIQDFLYAHYVAPHTPYLEHPLRFLKKGLPLEERNVEALRVRYLGEVEETDRAVGELLEMLSEDTIVIVTADHGEEFLEHGRFEHGHGLHREVLHVPLIIAGPGLASGKRVETPVSLVDVAPTILELCGIDLPESFEGISLADRLDPDAGADALPSRLLFSETASQSLTPGRRFFAVEDGSHKLIRERTAAGAAIEESLFEIASDRAEHTPVAGDPPAALAAALDAYEARAATRRATQGEAVSDEELERMNALGYVDEGKR